jgi:dTDP-4-amino-4,6-dideoxygalactose transaminase
MAFPARVGAICVVHQMGFPCDMGAASALAARLGIPLIEDAACAIGSELSMDNGATWNKIGAPHGDIACFSFHPRKVITTGEGGMLTTANSRYDRQFRLLRQHAMSVSDAVRHGSKSVIFEEYGELGFNYRMSDIQAAVGIEQLGRLDALLEQRRERATRYHRLLRDNPLVATYSIAPWTRPNWQSYPVFIADAVFLPQQELMQRLLDAGISTRRGIMNAHQEKAYGFRHGLLPHSEYARDHAVLLPLYPSMTDEEQDAVVHALNACAGESAITR